MFLLPILALLDSDEDRALFEKFYYKYEKLVMHTSLKRLNNNFHLAEENCQDVFIALAKNFNKIKDIDSKETKGYVYTVANGLAINKFKKEIVNHPVTIDNENVIKISDDSFDLYSIMELKTAIDSLDEDEKTYYRLKHLYGLTLKEIGTIFNESAATVSRKLDKIANKLRERLGGNCE